MYFRVEPEVFSVFPSICIGIVVAEGIDNATPSPQVRDLLARVLAEAPSNWGADIKAMPAISVWRESFTRLGWNPNKFPSSIEALVKRVSKRPEIPQINNVVDLVNAMSVRHIVPMGAHDIARVVGDLEVRFSRPGERFTPFGKSTPETVDTHELVYADADEVRTRKWVWRQGEKAKVTAETSHVFFPIDGFYGATEAQVRVAQADLTEQLAKAFPDCRLQQLWVDSQTPAVRIRD